MKALLHPTPSVGSLIKKIVTLNPELGVQEIISLIRQATRKQGEGAKDFAAAEVVDENLALELARATLKQNKAIHG